MDRLTGLNGYGPPGLGRERGADAGDVSDEVRDEGVYPALDAQAALYGRLRHRLFVDLYVRGRKLSECKKLYIARYGLTARQFNAIACELNGKVRAAREARKHRIETLQEQIVATGKAIRRLQREGP